MTCSALLCSATPPSLTAPPLKPWAKIVLPLRRLSQILITGTPRETSCELGTQWRWYINTAPELQQIYSVLGADTRGDGHVRWGMWSNCTFPHFCSQPQISSPKTCLKSVYSPSKSEARWSNRLGGRRKCRQWCHVLTANSDIGTISSYLISFTGTFFWRSCCTIPCSSEGSKISKASPSSLYLNKIKIFKCINTIFILHFDKMSRWHEIT